MRGYAYHAHHLLRDDPQTPESVEVLDHGDEGIVVRLDYLDRYAAEGAIGILKKKWQDGPMPFRGSLVFEDMFERAFPPAELRPPLVISFDDEDGYAASPPEPHPRLAMRQSGGVAKAPRRRLRP